MQAYFAIQIGLWTKFNPDSTAFQRAERWRLCSWHWSCPIQMKWTPYDKISGNLKRAVLVSEDDIFFQHKGVRVEDMQKAWEKKIWWDNYNTYLASPEWRAKSLAVRARDPVCQGCRQNFSEQAHHVTYRNVGHEFLFELIALCAKCHDRLHDLKKAQNAKYNRK
jgi:hypothetical protein